VIIVDAALLVWSIEKTLETRRYSAEEVDVDAKRLLFFAKLS
jgi:hypothetical protein